MKNSFKVLGVLVFTLVFGLFFTACSDNENNNNQINPGPGTGQNPVIPSVVTPEANPIAGVVASGTEVILSTSTEDAEIWYTTNGNTPAKEGAGSTKYTTAIIINSDTTIKAIAVKDGMNDSPIFTAVYTLEKVVTPTATPNTSAVASGTTVTLSTSTSGAEIWYTTNGNTPAKEGAGSTKYTTTITINSKTTIKAIAVKDGMNNSSVLTATYRIFGTSNPSWVDPCKQTTQLTGATDLAKGNGNKNLSGSPYGYEIFMYDGGGGSMAWYGPNQGGGGAYKAVWAGYYLARLGYFFGSGKTYDQYNNFYVDYNYTRTANSTSDGGMIGIYGWSRNPSASNAADRLIEYYIVDDWLYGNSDSYQMTISNVDNASGNRKQLGTYTVDGATYTLIYTTRTDQSIDGNKTFAQIVSFRTGARKAGTISVTEHFEEWHKYITLGNLYEVKFKVESFGKNGSLDLSYLYLSQEENVRVSGNICSGNCSAGD